jgi:hypothetical protein
VAAWLAPLSTSESLRTEDKCNLNMLNAEVLQCWVVPLDMHAVAESLTSEDCNEAGMQAYVASVLCSALSQLPSNVS